MSIVVLNDQQGQIDDKQQSIQFQIPLINELFKRIEDQGVIKSQYIRDMQFKNNHQNIILQFQYYLLKRYHPKLIQSYQEFINLLKEAIKSIYQLNKKEFTLLAFNEKNILIRNIESQNYIYFFHFEKNINRDFQNEVETLKFIIQSYYAVSQNQHQEVWHEISNFTQMTQILNSKYINSLNGSNQFLSENINEMKQFYKLKETKQIVLQKNTIQDILDQISIQKKLQESQDMQEIYTHLFQIFIIDIEIQDLQLGLNLRQELTNLKQELIISLKKKFEDKKFFDQICLQQAFETFASQIYQKNLTETTIQNQDINSCLKKIQQILQQDNYREKRYLIGYICLNSHEICQILSKELHLPYDKKSIDSQELIIVINNYYFLEQSFKSRYQQCLKNQ